MCKAKRAYWLITVHPLIIAKFSYNDRPCLTQICHAFGVLKAAAIIRLRQLDYIEDRPYLEYHDSLEVWS